MVKLASLVAALFLCIPAGLLAQQPGARPVGTLGFGVRPDPPPPPPPKDLSERVPKGVYMERARRAVVPMSAGGHQYADSKTLVLIYTTYRKEATDPAPTDFVTPTEVQVLRDEVEHARNFVWRHSRAGFNLQLTDFVVVNRELTLDQLWAVAPGAYWLPYWSLDGSHSVAQDIVDLGLINAGYDAVIVLYAWSNTAGAGAAYGGGTYGVGTEALNGAAYVGIPLEWGIEGKRDVIIHEYLHVIDSLFAASGEPGFPHADRPNDYAGDYNNGWEFNAWMLQTWPREKWLNTGVYAPIRSAVDDDMDGLPDQGLDGASAPLSVTEQSFGSSPTMSDTDGDGLNDRLEMSAGLFETSSPVTPDTDGDGFRDGLDLYPLFAVRTDRPRGTPIIDGVLSSGEHRRLGAVRDATGTDLNGEAYLEWDDHYLYVAARVLDDHVDGGFSEPWWNDHVIVRVDALNDGYQFHGIDNLEVFVGPLGASGQPFAYPRILRADGAIDTTTIVESDLVYAVRFVPGGYELEIGIPAIPAIGLNPRIGYRSGYQVGLRDFDAADWSWLDYDLITGRLSPTVVFADLTLTDSSSMPVVTLKINGAHPQPPIVFTPGPVNLTMDVIPGAWASTLQWYWAILLGSQIYWVTPGGWSPSAAPLVDMPPTTAADYPLLEVNLPTGTILTNVLLLMDGATLVSYDWIVAVVAPSPSSK